MMKKMFKEMVKEMDLFIVTGIFMMILFGVMMFDSKANNEVEDVITNQDIAEYAVNLDHEYEGVVEVKIDSVEYDEYWGGEEINCYVYVDGELKAYRGINKNFYQNMMERDRKDS